MNPPFLSKSDAMLLEGLVVALLIVVGLGCNTFCNDHPQREEVVCLDPDYSMDTLILSNFERGMNPTEYCGEIRIWSSPKDRVQVATWYVPQVAPLPNHLGKYSIILEIAGNELVAEDTCDFVAGGLTFRLSDIPEGIHFDFYDLLEFDMKMESGSFLEETLIRLEDTTGNHTPELSLKHFGEIGDSWSHFVIPLDTLSTRQWFHGPEISSVQRGAVTHLITIAKHTGTESNPTNGMMYLDNVFLTKR